MIMPVSKNPKNYLVVELVNAFTEGFITVNPTEEMDEEGIDNLTKIFRNQVSTMAAIFEHYSPYKTDSQALSKDLETQKQYSRALEEELSMLKRANSGMKKDADIYKNYADSFLEIIKSLSSK